MASTVPSGRTHHQERALRGGMPPARAELRVQLETEPTTGLGIEHDRLAEQRLGGVARRADHDVVRHAAEPRWTRSQSGANKSD
jgi:hypothetical protein